MKDAHASLIVIPLKVYSMHVGLRRGVVACIRACAALQPCPHDRVKPTLQGAVEEDAQGAHKVPHK